MADIVTRDQVGFFNTYILPKLNMVTLMVRDSKPQEQIFSYLGIDKQTFYKFKSAFPQLRNAIVDGKLVYAQRAQNAMYKLVQGGKYKSTQVTEFYTPTDEQGKMKLVSKKVKTTIRQEPPNMRAIEMVLTNKDADNWKKQVPQNYTQNNAVINIDANQQMIDTMLKRLNGLQDTPKETIIDAEQVDPIEDQI